MIVLKILAVWTLVSAFVAPLIGACIAHGSKSVRVPNALRIGEEHALAMRELETQACAATLARLPITRVRLAGLLIPTL